MKDQLPSVVTLAQNGQIDDSVVQIGANDMSLNDVVNFAEGSDPTKFINSYVNDIETVVNSVAAANPNVHQVFVNNPDPTVSPEFQQIAATPGFPTNGLELVSAVVAKEDALTDAYALAHNVGVVDIFTAIDTLTNASPVTLASQSFASPFAPDGHHPAPFVQGLLGNAIDLAFNETFGQTLPILSDQQIVHNVGLTPDANTTYYNVQPFVLVPLPGDVNSDDVVNGLDINVIASHWLQTGAGIAGDANDDGVVNGLDINLIAQNWLRTSEGGVGVGAAETPEPSTLILAALCGLALLAWRRHR